MNEPAFPISTDNGPRIDSSSGMTLRDYFAAKALPVWIQAQIDASVDDLSTSDITRECYRVADAMLAERLK